MYTRFFKHRVVASLCIAATLTVTLPAQQNDDYTILFSENDNAHTTFREWWGRRENKKKVAIGAAVVGAAMCYYYRTPLRYWWHATMMREWWYDSRILFLSNKIVGKEKTQRINNRTIVIRQVHVKSQFSSGGGGGASCGYGAFFWGDRLREALVKNIPLGEKDFYDSKAIADSHGPHGGRRAFITALRNEQNESISRRNKQLEELGRKEEISELHPVERDWLDSQEINELVRREDKQKFFTVCADINEITSGMLDVGVKACRQAIYKKGKSFAHAFIIGTMQHPTGEDKKFIVTNSRDKGHYITVVFHTDGKGHNSYTIADTANQFRLEDTKLVAPLINSIEGAVSQDTKGKGEDD